MKLRKRQPTQQLGYPWPFAESHVPGRGLVLNVTRISHPRTRIATKPRHKIKEK